MKKNILILSVVILTLATACNRKRFENRLTGDWSLKKYVYGGLDETSKRRDTTMFAYKLSLAEGQTFEESWQSLAFSANTIILADTLSYDTVNMVYLIDFDTITRVDTTFTPYFISGRWDLLNSEADLQLRDATTNGVRIYRIQNLTPKALNLRNGSEEMFLEQ